MCACEPGYVCSKCTDTPQDWRYEWDEPAELDEDVAPHDLEYDRA